MRVNRRVFLLAVLLAKAALVVASPPIDVTRPEVGSKRRVVKRLEIRDEDLVFQDVNDPPPAVEKDLATVRVDVIGRGLPHRDGKAILRLVQFDKVKVLRPSKDGRWFAVQTLRNGRKAWVPKVALRVPAATEKAKAAEATAVEAPIPEPPIPVSSSGSATSTATGKPMDSEEDIANEVKAK